MRLLNFRETAPTQAGCRATRGRKVSCYMYVGLRGQVYIGLGSGDLFCGWLIAGVEVGLSTSLY
jgi:hypothetical protein